MTFIKKNRLTILLVVAFCSCQEKGPTQESAASNLQKNSKLEYFTDSLFQASIDNSILVGGEVLIYKAGDTLLRKTYGKASMELNIPMPLNAVYEIGSTTKQFTAAAILKLAEANKLELDKDISNYINFNSGGRKVTVKQLLNHTSGIREFTDLPEFFQFSAESHNRDTLFSLIEDSGFEFEPGEKYRYNNSAYFLAGMLIEQVSGMKYEDYITQTIFEPLGMQNTYFCSNTYINPGKVNGYDYNTKLEALVLPEIIDPQWIYSAGAICSSTQDILIWLTNLHNGKVLSADSYKLLTTPTKLNNGSNTNYGMGIWNITIDGHKFIGHGGRNPGFNVNTSFYPESNLYLIIFLNSGGPFYEYSFTKELRKIILPSNIDI